MPLKIGITVTLGEVQLAVFDDGDGCSGDVMLFHLPSQFLIQEGLQFGAIGGALS
jgi:hypothetical protein